MRDWNCGDRPLKLHPQTAAELRGSKSRVSAIWGSKVWGITLTPRSHNLPDLKDDPVKLSRRKRKQCQLLHGFTTIIGVFNFLNRSESGI